MKGGPGGRRKDKEKAGREMSLMENQKKLMMDLTRKGREDDFSIPGLEK